MKIRHDRKFFESRQNGWACFLLLVTLTMGCSSDEASKTKSEKDIARRAIEGYILDFWINKDTAALERCITEDMVYHYMGRVDPGDPKAQKENLHNFRGGFPELRASIDLLLVNRDFGAAYTTWEGTQSGPLLGIPPSGRKLTWSVSYFFRMRGTRIAELWEDWNEGGVYHFLQTGNASVLPDLTGNSRSMADQPELNQVDLMKQFTALWRSEVAKDTVEFWEAKSYGVGVSAPNKLVTFFKAVVSF